MGPEILKFKNNEKKCSYVPNISFDNEGGETNADRLSTKID